MQNNSPHTFHIPVMGLAFTVDTPIKVARYGINSVISIIEDRLVELMRSHYSNVFNKLYTPISDKDDDYRAKRITGYLNLVNTIVKEQIAKLRESAFEAGSDIVKYFEMLPSANSLRQTYEKMKVAGHEEKQSLINFLRSQVAGGDIDVNIMTKVDKINHDKDGNVLPDGSDAVAALRGYINSELRNSSIVFSAGMNPRLFNYMERTTVFDAKGWGQFDKRIVIKVSDYRSALIQGKYLAKKGLWVSEFRIESGLNCGGHAFATDGTLLGPILEEFKTNKETLRAELFRLYKPVAEAKSGMVFDEPHPLKLTVQGGIGNHHEAELLKRRYGIDSTGWGTPFLLCPEATTVDEPTLKLLGAAKEEDVVLSKNSPLGIRFNYLKGTSAEKEKLDRIAKGKPGSPCTEKHLVSNTEFTKEPICTASHKYQKMKIAQLRTLDLSPEEFERQHENVVNKECLCVGLMNSAVQEYKLPPIKKLTAVTICPGPNIAYFDKIVTLHEMTDHIYGRTNLITRNDRPHMFLKELQLNIDYLAERVNETNTDSDVKTIKDLSDFAAQLLNGIRYYHTFSEDVECPETWTEGLHESQRQIETLLATVSDLQLAKVS